MPTIQVPPNINAWTDMLAEGDSIIIVGSGISPHNDIRRALEPLALNAVYLEPDDENSRRWHTNDYLALNHHHRRNLALLTALADTDADVIISIDDDNFPTRTSWVTQARDWLTGPEPKSTRVTSSSDGWFSTGSLCFPPVVHRGTPQALRHPKYVATQHTRPIELQERVGVYEALWTGDPDIDAIERIVNDPRVDVLLGNVVLNYGTWAPFNSQATAVHRDLAPLFMMWTGVGRYDDIWCSYLMRAYMDATNWLFACGGEPGISQVRNEHDLLKDLDAELLGMRHTPAIIDLIKSWAASEVTPMINAVDAMESFAGYIRLAARRPEFEWLLPTTVVTFSTWVTDLREAMNK